MPFNTRRKKQPKLGESGEMSVMEISIHALLRTFEAIMA